MQTPHVAHLYRILPCIHSDKYQILLVMHLDKGAPIAQDSQTLSYNPVRIYKFSQFVQNLPYQHFSHSAYILFTSITYDLLNSYPYCTIKK